MDASLLAWLNQEDPPKPKPRKEPFYNDPMDPYTLPTSDNNYDNVTDVINRKPFAAVYPQSYTPIPNYFKRFGYAPFYQPGEGEDYAHGAITIAGMIELSNNGLPWALKHDEDYDIIIASVEAYIAGAMEANSQDLKVRAWVKNMQRFLKIMKKGRERMWRRNPAMRGKRPFSLRQLLFGEDS